MEKDIIINSSGKSVEIALLENNKITEIHHETTTDKLVVGDIFLGKIKKIMPSLNAAFVDLGHRNDAFLHFTDLGPQITSLKVYTQIVQKNIYKTTNLDNFRLEEDNPKNGKIDQILKRNDLVVMQVLKEPISSKGPRMTCEITLPGRFLVLTPFSDVIAISKKIASSEERKRLKLLMQSVKPKNFGVVIRTAAEGKKVADLHQEIKGLMDKWEEMQKSLKEAKGPGKLLSELDKTSSLLRDLLSEDFNKVIVDDKDMYVSLKSYLNEIAPSRVNILELYKGNRHIFEEYNISRQIKSSFGKSYTMSSGAYLVIEHTEALHVIDVNSGPKMQRMSQADAALAVNLEAAEEIARQLRLRDIGGIIIVDFIDMRKSDHRKSLYNKMKEFMRNDRAQHTILPLSKFGLMQITRQRVRPVVEIDTTEVCPTCQGTGKSKPAVLVVDDLKRDLDYILNNRPKSKITIEVHPFIFAFLKKGFPNEQMKLYMKYNKWIKIKQNNEYHMLEYRFFDGRNDEIRID